MCRNVSNLSSVSHGKLRSLKMTISTTSGSITHSQSRCPDMIAAPFRPQRASPLSEGALLICSSSDFRLRASISTCSALQGSHVTVCRAHVSLPESERERLRTCAHMQMFAVRRGARPREAVKRCDVRHAKRRSRLKDVALQI